MSQDPRHTDDKFETHYRLQLSALVDGELAPDEARFLLRRMQHDGELSGRFERWQLCGDVMRGQVRRATAPDFSARVAVAIAAEPASTQAVAQGGRRLSWGRWSGGAALAASVAAVAMFVGYPEISTGPAVETAPATALQTLPSTEAVLATTAPAIATPPVVAPPAAPAARPASMQRQPRRDVASVAPPRREPIRPPAVDAVVADAGTHALAPADPFASSAPLQARPWPRAALPQPAGGGYTASFGEPAATASFYPFDPRLPVQAATSQAPADDDLPAPPDDDGQR